MGYVAEFVRPVLFSIGNISVHTYGFFIALAFLATYRLADMEFQRLKIDSDSSNILLAAMIGGVFGAKIHYVATWDMNALFDMNTGLSFQGGLLGGAIAVLSYVHFYEKNRVSSVADALGPLVPLGHAIGKLGCFFSGDGCYGGSTSVPWGMSFPNGLNPVYHFVHPSPLYEFVFSFGLFVYFWKTRNPAVLLPFDKFTRVLTGMCLSRIVVELWRDHAVVIKLGKFGGVNQYQIFAIVCTVMCLVVRFVLAKFVWNKTASKTAAKQKKNK
jgi:phosphatidylglycerol---prolipoprotein diacylglyceryl transferase